MRTFRSLVLAGALALASAALTPAALMPAALADDCRCEPPARSYRTSHRRVPLLRTGSGTYSHRDRCHPSTRYVIPRRRSYGTSWSVLRNHLPSGRSEIRRLYVRNYFLRRYPFAVAPGVEQDQAGHVDTLLAVGANGAEGPPKLDAQGHLDRGAARFYVRDYDGARTDFEAVLKDKPQEHRARFGLVMTAVCKNEWRVASNHLAVLAKAGELKRGDRIAVDGCFQDPTILPSLVKGLEQYAGYAVTDAHAHLVTGWALAGQGDLKGARRYVRLAKRRIPSNAAVQALEKSLAPAKKAKPVAKQPKKKPVTPVLDEQVPADKTKEMPRAPATGLHREVASASK